MAVIDKYFKMGLNSEWNEKNKPTENDGFIHEMKTKTIWLLFLGIHALNDFIDIQHVYCVIGKLLNLSANIELVEITKFI